FKWRGGARKRERPPPQPNGSARCGHAPRRADAGQRGGAHTSRNSAPAYRRCPLRPGVGITTTPAWTCGGTERRRFGRPAPRTRAPRRARWRARPRRRAAPRASPPSAARAGSEDALGQSVNELSPLLWQVARSAGLSEGDAEDVLQTVWIRLITHLDGIHEAT